MRRKKKALVLNRRNQPLGPEFVAFACCFAFLLTRAAGQTAPVGTVINTDAAPIGSESETNQLQTAPALANEAAPPSPLAGTSQLSVGAPPLAPIAALGPGPFHWGFLDVRPHVLYQLSYGSGLQFSPGQKGNSLINQLSPGVLLHLGSHWTLDYTPTLRFYSDSRFKDGTDHSVNLAWGTSYEDWTLGFSQGYASSSQPLVETGGQTDQQSYSTAINVGYQISSKASLSFGADQSFRFVSEGLPSAPLTDTKEWSTMDWFNYQFAPRLSASAGVGFTYDQMSVGPNMLSEQVQGRVSWHAYHKLQFDLSGGLNNQQFLGSHSPDLITPIFSLSARYQLFDTTTVSLTGSRTVSPSYFQGASSEATGVNADLRQRLLGRLYLDLGGGYSTTTYHSTPGSPVQGNVSSFDRTLFNIGLSTIVFKRLSVSAFYQIAYSTSTSALYDYTTRQTGLTIGYQF